MTGEYFFIQILGEPGRSVVVRVFMDTTPLRDPLASYVGVCKLKSAKEPTFSVNLQLYQLSAERLARVSELFRIVGLVASKLKENPGLLKIHKVPYGLDTVRVQLLESGLIIYYPADWPAE